MVVNIEGSEYKGEQCMFVTISTGFNRNRGHGSQNFCQVSGFVNFELVTLEERRLITTKLYTTAQEANEDGEIDENDEREEDGISNTILSKRKPKVKQATRVESDTEDSSFPNTPLNIDQEKSKKIVQEFQTCRSIVLDESTDDTRRFIKVAEWQRSNGKLVVQKNVGSSSLPATGQTYHQLELPQNSAFLTDISLLLAEKLMARTMKTGKFDKISTLDKRCLFAPLCLESRRDVKDNFSGEVFKIVKSSPVDKGATETSYSLEGFIRDRTIITAKKLRYHLKNVNNTESNGSNSSSDEDNNAKSSSNYRRRTAENNQFHKDMRFSDRFFAENLHDTINRNLSILRQRMFEENLRRNLIKMYTMISGQKFVQPMVTTSSIEASETSTPINTNDTIIKDSNNNPASSTALELPQETPRGNLAEAMRMGSSKNNNTEGSIVFLIKAALCEVLLHKPEEPLVYLKHYFTDLKQRKEGNRKEELNKSKNNTNKSNLKAGNANRKERMRRSNSDKAIATKIGNKMVRTSRPHSSSDIVNFK